MAGVYVGLGIVPIFTLDNLLDPSVRPLVMSATLGIALTLVIIAGSEPFTGHTMFLTLDVKVDIVSHNQTWATLSKTWLDNLVGSVFVALFYSWGDGSPLPADASIVHSVALARMATSAIVLFFKGVLCNWSACLAVWVVIRAEGAVKLLTIWWCPLAFVASGYEHSVVNIALFTFSWFGHHSEAYTPSGTGHSPLWVTLGNTLSDVVLIGLGYWYAMSKSERPAPAEVNRSEAAVNS